MKSWILRRIIANWGGTLVPMAIDAVFDGLEYLAKRSDTKWDDKTIAELRKYEQTLKEYVLNWLAG